MFYETIFPFQSCLQNKHPNLTPIPTPIIESDILSHYENIIIKNSETNLVDRIDTHDGIGEITQTSIDNSQHNKGVEDIDNTTNALQDGINQTVVSHDFSNAITNEYNHPTRHRK